MKNTIAAVILILLSLIAGQAFAATEFQQKELIHRYVNYPMEDWEKLSKANKKLIDDNLLKMVKDRMYQTVMRGLSKNPRREYIPSETFIFAYLADFIGKKLKKKEQNRFYLARLYEQRGRLAAAADICNNILMSEPKNIEIMVFQAELFERLRMPNEAFQVYQRILKVNKKNKRAMFRLGMLYLELAQYKHAVEIFKKLLKVDPNNNIAKRFVNLYEGKINNNPQSGSSDEKAIQHFLLAERLFNKGKFSAAAKEYSNAVGADPTFGKAYIYLGVALMRQKKYDSAIGVLENAVKVSKDDSEAYHFLGLAFERKFNYSADVKLLDKAIENYQKAVEKDKDYYKAVDDLERAKQRRMNLKKEG